MKIPFLTREKPMASEQRDANLNSLFDKLGADLSTPPPAAAALAAVVSAAELIAGPFLGARAVGATGPATAALMASLAREMAYSGNSLRYIDVNPVSGFIDLVRPSTWEIVAGNTAEPSWIYRLELPRPGNQQPIPRLVPARGLIHVRLDASENEPWRGVAPWKQAGLTSGVAAHLERALQQRSDENVSALIPMPDGSTFAQRQGIARDIRDSRGKVAVPETTSGGFGQGALAKPEHDYSVKRTGPEHSVANHQLRQQLQADVLSAYGIPGAYMGLNTQGTTLDAIRRSTFYLSQGWANIIAAELSTKLNQSVSLDWSDVLPGAIGVNMSQRIRSWMQLVQAGASPASAAAIVGIGEPEMQPQPEPEPANQPRSQNGNGHVETRPYTSVMS